MAISLRRSEYRATPAPLILANCVVSGQFVSRRNKAEYPIPAKLNVALCILQTSCAFSILCMVSQTSNVVAFIALSLGFAFVMQTGFCLAHEVVHRKLHPNRRLNTGLGVILFALFPGSLHFFEVVHLLHHRRNRSDDELEDYVLPGESAWFKRAMYYLLISGLFWLLLPLSSLVIALIPLKKIRLPHPADESGSFRRFVQFLNNVQLNRVRRDVIVALALWMAAFPILHLHFGRVAVCYAFFAFSWASQQYIYHVRTPRHTVLGALDLKIWKPLGWLYLHFNYHLTHHLASWVPWNHLPKITEQQPQQDYLRTYALLWIPPEGLERSWPRQYQTSGPLPMKEDFRSTSNLDLPW
jgi:fatty acid desaturase